MDDHLSMEEVRVLGALMEKEATTPDYYPLTLNSLVNACNQKSNRDPVVQFDDAVAMRALDRLRERQYAFRVDMVDSRVPKYEQNFSKRQGLTEQETAVMCVLMLRGPQTVGEIRGRTGRIYPFDTMDEVTITLETLAERADGALVARLPVQPGRKEARYAHLLMGEVEIPDEPVSGTVVVQSADASEIKTLEARVAALEETVADLSEQLEAFRSQFD